MAVTSQTMPKNTAHGVREPSKDHFPKGRNAQPERKKIFDPRKLAAIFPIRQACTI
jgi:hypothetical protein